MSILDRLNMGIKAFKAKSYRTHSRERTDYRDGPEKAPRYNPNRPSDAQLKALKTHRKQEELWQTRERERKARLCKKNPALRTFVATLNAVYADTDILYDGVLDIDIKGLIEDLKVNELSPRAREVALDETRAFVKKVHKHHYGHDPGNECFWLLPEGIMTTWDEAKTSLFPNGITQETLADPEEDSITLAQLSGKF